MNAPIHGRQAVRYIRATINCLLLAFVGLVPASAPAADHGDTPVLTAAGRHDAMITDLHVFTSEYRLVLSLCLDPGIPPSVASYQFASDLTVTVYLDNHTSVSHANSSDDAIYGGTIDDPAAILEDISFQVTFAPNGLANLAVTGLTPEKRSRVRLYTGLRDDPFIRGPRAGRNVAAIVIDLPLIDALAGGDTLLAWATTKVAGMPQSFQELGGRALRSMFPENHPMNSMHPSQHTALLGVPPDVIIFDPSRPAGFPNGRLLTDDVVDMVGDSRVLNNDAPFPSTNDVAFLGWFPYLAPPHGSAAAAVPTASAWGLAVLFLLILAGAKVWFSRRATNAGTV